MNISDRNQILTEASVGGGKASIHFGPDRIRTLVSMVTGSSHRVIMGKFFDHSSAFMFDRRFLFLAGNDDIHYIPNEFEIQSYRTKDCGVSCP